MVPTPMYPKPSSSKPAPLSCAPRWCSCAYMATPTADDKTPLRAQLRYEFSLLKRSVALRERPRRLSAACVRSDAAISSSFRLSTFTSLRGLPGGYFGRSDLARAAAAAAAAACPVGLRGWAGPPRVTVGLVVDGCCCCWAGRRKGGVARAPRCWMRVMPLERAIQRSMGTASCCRLAIPWRCTSVARVARDVKIMIALSPHGVDGRMRKQAPQSIPCFVVCPVCPEYGLSNEGPVTFKFAKLRKPANDGRTNMRALTEFALREALALLLDDPTPHNVALAATGEAPEASQSMESQTDEMSEDSESQAARQEMLAARETQPRVVMVRYTNASTKMITLVDRSHSVDAFVPDGVMTALKDKYGYQTLSRLRGSVLRVEKYHFSTPALCYREEKIRDPQETKSAATPRMDRAKICLFVEQLSVVDDNELAVNPLPHLEEHEAIANIVSKLSESELEQRIMLRQGRALPAATDNDEIHPLLEEDVAIPEEEERAMNAQEGWDDDDEEGDGLSDSQLIEENGPVSDSLPEIPEPSTRRGSLSQRMSQLWNAVRWVVVPTTEEPEATEEVPESQDAYHFQQDNIEQAFVEYEDTESEGESDDEEEPSSKTADKEGESEAGEEEEHREIDTQTTETQLDVMYETENGPLTQAPDETSQSETPPQPRDLPVGKPNTQLSPEDGTEDSQARVDASQLHTSVSQPNDSQYELGEAADQHWHTQADDDSQMMIPQPQSIAQDELAETEDESAADEDVADDDHGEVELHVGGQNDDERSDKSAANVPASARAESNRSEESLRDQSDAERASFRQKRKRALVPEIIQKRQRQDQDVESPELSQRSGKRARSSGASSNATFGLSSWKKKPANVQQQRPAKQYQHLLPPFRLDSIMSMIANKE